MVNEDIRVLDLNLSVSRPCRAGMLRCFEPGPGGAVSGESATGNGSHSGGHGGPPYEDLVKAAFRRVGHRADHKC
jgi:hypothetical protein